MIKNFTHGWTITNHCYHVHLHALEIKKQKQGKNGAINKFKKRRKKNRWNDWTRLVMYYSESLATHFLQQKVSLRSRNSIFSQMKSTTNSKRESERKEREREMRRRFFLFRGSFSNLSYNLLDYQRFGPQRPSVNVTASVYKLITSFSRRKKTQTLNVSQDLKKSDVALMHPSKPVPWILGYL